MDEGIDIYCSTCFAMPGEACRTKYLVHGQDEVTPVICPTHSARLSRLSPVFLSEEGTQVPWPFTDKP